MDSISSVNVHPKIHKLPPELLIEIFLLSVPQTPKKWYPHLRLSWICRYWREIINGSPVFWTEIKFSPWKGKDFIEQLISRSGSAELTVFSPRDDDLFIGGSSQLDGERFNEIATVFYKLLQRQNHRIKFLFLNERLHRGLARLKGLLRKEFPAIRGLIIERSSRRHPRLSISKKTVAHIKFMRNLDYLNIFLPLGWSLSGLETTFRRLRGLHIHLPYDLLQQFFKILAVCSNLELLAVSTVAAFQLPSAIILPNLVSLRVDSYTLIERLCAPSLRHLVMIGDRLNRSTQQRYLVLNDYDLSSVTHLSIAAVPLGLHAGSTCAVCIRGSAGAISPSEVCIPSSMLKMADSLDLELESDMFPSASPSKSIYFGIGFRVAPLWPEQFLSKLLSKLQNIEEISINLNRLDFKLFEGLFKEMVDKFVSTNLRGLIINNAATEASTLRMSFQILNTFSLLSNLETITFSVPPTGPKCSGHDFGKEVVEFLRQRKNVGCIPLRTFQAEGYCYVSRKWITKAAKLQTQIIQTGYSLPRKTPLISLLKLPKVFM